MRHNIAGRKFGRTANQRKALFRGLATAAIKYERIETTVAKAKEARRIVEKLVTLAKRGDLHSKRLAMAKLPNRELIIKLFDVIAPRFADRSGGYMRIVQTRQRVNDRADMAVLEFVDYEEVHGTDSKGKKAAPKKAAAKKEEAAPVVKTEKTAEAKEETKKPAVKKKAAPKKAAPKKAADDKEEKKPAAKKKAAPKKAAPKKAADDKAEKKPAAKKKAAPKKKAEPKDAK